MELWKIIVESNTFNFIILVIILAVIIKVCNVSSLLDSAVNKVKEAIEGSKEAKSASEEELKQAGELSSKVSGEVEEISQNADKNIDLLEDKIAQETQEQKQALELNAQKSLEAKEKEIISNLSNKTILASLELAKSHIKHLLEVNPKYHQKFIDDSIKELDKLKQ